MPLTTRTFTIPKAGNAPEENEDAARPAAAQTVALGGGEPFRASVADGASQSAFAGVWAGLLADGWQAGDLAPDNLAAGVRNCAAAWRARVAHGFDALPWFAQEKAQRGAWAAVLGVTIDAPATSDKGENGGATWQALSLGDCGLFHVRADDVKAAFPYARSDDYNSRPLLAGTEEASIERLGKIVQIATGDLHAGDALYLATDALAAWFLRECEANRAPWRWLRGLRASELNEARGGVSFSRFADEQRALGRLENDDTTLVIIELQRDGA